MVTADLSTESISLAIGFFAAAILVFLSLYPPQTTPSSAHEALPQDAMGVTSTGVAIRRLLLLSLWLFHAASALSYQSSGGICPNSQNLSPTLFTWSPTTITILLVVFTAAPIRLLAMKQLNSNFTFRLQKPDQLITTGLYAYVQHPSYPTNWLLSMMNFILFLRRDGVFGCFMPIWFARFGTGIWMDVTWLTWMVMLGGGGLIGIKVRVKDEEDMLSKTFGETWEDWNRRTSRFVPGIL